ncbi:MAG: serine hydrolase, partial [Acetobacteraceae bacterium]
MKTAALLLRSGLCLAVFLFAAAPGLSARPARKTKAPHVFAALANPGPAPVVLEGKIPLPADVPPAPTLPDASSYVLMDFATGTVIAAKAPHLHLPPASLTKLMTVYLTYRAIKAGTLPLDRSVAVSTAAWRAGGSRMFIDPATPVTIKDL